MDSDNYSLIIQTKLNRPFVTKDLVPRSNLLARLNERQQRPLTLVTAPAGYGKSTLLSSWLDTLTEQPTAWLSREETNAFLLKSLGRQLDDKMVTDIYGRSEGWITDLHLAVLSLRHAERIGTFPQEIINKDDRFVTEYLMAEVLADQTEIVQEWLLKTAVLDRFCPALCDALCASPENTQPNSFNGQIFKEHLTNNHLFIIALDTQQTWYRYHHLFGQFLRQVAKQQYTEAELALLHRKAAQWFAQNQLLEESLHHALIAKDFDAAAQVVENHARTLLDEDKWHILEVWLAQLPNDHIQQRPILLLAKAWVAFHQFALWAIPPILERIEEILTDDAEKRP
ncbi:MAG: hypothetical protein GY796_13860 [Chloroflexi bacterium]|nr:hypothetical protein [Chloroflexota bacterium]